MPSKPRRARKPANPWMKHLSSFRKSHPKLSLKKAMTKAKKSYKPKKVIKKSAKPKKVVKKSAKRIKRSAKRRSIPKEKKLSRCQVLKNKSTCEMDGLFDDDHMRKCRWNITKLSCEKLPKELRERATYMQAKDETRYVAPARRRVITSFH
jgi:hypothetical protein